MMMMMMMICGVDIPRASLSWRSCVRSKALDYLGISFGPRVQSASPLQLTCCRARERPFASCPYWRPCRRLSCCRRWRRGGGTCPGCSRCPRRWLCPARKCEKWLWNESNATILSYIVISRSEKADVRFVCRIAGIIHSTTLISCHTFLKGNNTKNSPELLRSAF